MEPLINHFFIFLFTRLPSSNGASHISFFCIFGFYNISLFSVPFLHYRQSFRNHQLLLSSIISFLLLLRSCSVSSRLVTFCLHLSLLSSPYPSNLSFLNLLLIPPPPSPPLSSSLFTFLFISAYRDDDRRAFPTSLETRSIRQHNPKRSVRSASY